MRPVRLALTAAMVAGILWIASLANATVGDFRLVTGTVVAPVEVSTERTLVIQGDDGVMYFAELAPAEAFPRVRVGERVSLLARESFQAGHLLFAQVVSRVLENEGAAPAALPTALVSGGPATDVLESPDVIVGVVDDLRGRALRLTNRRGYAIEVDVSAIDADFRRDLKPGDHVTIFAPTRVNGFPVASGILVDHTAAPAALPRQP